MRTPTRLLGLTFLLALSPGLAACAATSATTPAPQHAANTAAPPSPRALPSDPMELLIGAPSAVVDVHVDRLRGSALYAHARSLLDRVACGTPDTGNDGSWQNAEFDWLSGVTERALFAVRAVDDHREWLAVLVGAYADQDAERLLAAVAHQPAAAPRQALGRFSIASQAEFSASVLDPHLAVVGAQAWVRAALDSVDHPSASFAASNLWRDLAARAHCLDRTLCLVAAADGPATQELQRALSSVGAKALGRQLSTADTVLGVAMPDGLQVSFLAQLPTPDAAEGARRLLKDWLWQAGLVIRLAGLPNVLDSAKAESNANLLQVELAVSAADLSQYEQRLVDMLGQSAQGCTVAAAVDATPAEAR